MHIQVTKVFSFTDQVNKGNPAGVVQDAEGLSEKQMMKISQLLQVSETAFVFPCDEADYLVRFFSPTVEVDLCGHATVALFSVIGTMIDSKRKKTLLFTQKTKAGLLSVSCLYNDQYQLDRVMMEQQKTCIQSVSYDTTDLAKAFCINEKHIRDDLPMKRVSTGLFTLPVCIDTYTTLKKVKPDVKKISSICRKVDVGSIHLFTFDTVEESSLYHARNFAPLYGVSEDPVTGTANGAVCAYLKSLHMTPGETIKCEQGDIVGMPGRVFVDISKEHVWVGGSAAIEKTMDVIV